MSAIASGNTEPWFASCVPVGTGSQNPESTPDVDALVSVNDALLEPLIRAAGSDDAQAELGRVVTEIIQPLATTACIRARQGTNVTPLDVEDVVATVSLRIIGRLRALARETDKAIASLERYVAILTYNTINDELRRRFPARTRLKNRLRYVLKHDRRLASWQLRRGALAAGLRDWVGREDVTEEIPDAAVPRTAKALDGSRPADAVVEVLEHLGQPATLEALVTATASLWHVVELPHLITSERRHEVASEVHFEHRQFARALWEEVRQLRPMQRKALLLNLRDGETVNVLSLFVLTGVTTFDDLAAALELSVTDLAAIWNELPIDDLRIAAMLGVTRQQVINLRKAARDRLARRLRHFP